jgi:site-specific recombinase XerD
MKIMIIFLLRKESNGDYLHIARHTFTTSVTHSNGVPIEIGSKVLGHNSLRTTQIYAKVLDKKILEDMDLFQAKLCHI